MFCSLKTSLLEVNLQASNLYGMVWIHASSFIQGTAYKCIALKVEVDIRGFFAFIYQSLGNVPSFNRVNLNF